MKKLLNISNLNKNDFTQILNYASVIKPYSEKCLENKNIGLRSLFILFLIIVFKKFPSNILIVSKLYDLKIVKLLFKTHIFVEVLPMSPIKNFIFFL